MKKKLKDLTHAEINIICKKYTDCNQECKSECPLNKHIAGQYLCLLLDMQNDKNIKMSKEVLEKFEEEIDFSN